MLPLLALLLALDHTTADTLPAPGTPPAPLCHTDPDRHYDGAYLYNDTNHRPMANRTSGGATACCAMCQETAGCVFWSLDACGCTGEAGADTSAGCCWLMGDELNFTGAGRKFGWCTTSGSVRPLPPVPPPQHYPPPAPPFSPQNITTWHVVWTGGQSNAVGTNTQGYQPGGAVNYPTTRRIQMFCAADHPGMPGIVKTGQCKYGDFAPAGFPHGGGLWGEKGVGFSKTFANLLLETLPEDHGVVVLNTGVGGTGFVDGRWAVPDGGSGSGCLTHNSVAAVKKLYEMLPAALGGTYHFSTMLWHQGEQDAGDNGSFQASYCHYLQNDLGPLIDHLRASFPGATAGTPFLDGGMLPYWINKDDPRNMTSKGKIEGVQSAIYAVNTSRPCTGTADSRIFPQFFLGTNHSPVPECAKPALYKPGCQPAGDPIERSGSSHDVIHFNATMATMMGHQYWVAYQRALGVSTVVPSAKTAACKGGEAVAPVPAVTCTK
jgi:hypothetical protein